jgi:monoterpene epsilon-lactone hydrolase
MTTPRTEVSLRARLMRPLVRRMLQRLLNAPAPTPVKRARLERLTRRLQLWQPRGTVFTPADFGGVPGEWVDNRRHTARGTMLYLHGGAYGLGSPCVYRDLTSRLAVRCGLRVAVADYRLAPEHPFPAAVDDALAAYRSLLDSGVPAGELIVAGDSAGGGLSLALAIKLKSTAMPQPAGIVCFSPWVDLTLSGESIRTRAAQDVVLTPEWLASSVREYVGGESARAPLVSPLFADLTGLPPLLVQVTDTEVLLDDATHLVRAAQQYGVQASVQVWPGLWHVWQLFAGKLPEADAALEQVAGFVLSRIGAAK